MAGLLLILSGRCGMNGCCTAIAAVTSRERSCAMERWFSGLAGARDHRAPCDARQRSGIFSETLYRLRARFDGIWSAFVPSADGGGREIQVFGLASSSVIVAVLLATLLVAAAFGCLDLVLPYLARYSSLGTAMIHHSNQSEVVSCGACKLLAFGTAIACLLEDSTIIEIMLNLTVAR